MKVLWFTNTACSASAKLNPNSYAGGWLSSLEKQLNKIPGIELNIAFYHNSSLSPFKYENSNYYPVYRKRNIVRELKKRLLNLESNESEEIQKLIDVVNKIEPDIIHIFGSEDNFGLIQSYINQPVVISIQGIINSIVEKLFSGIPKEITKRNEPLKSRLFLKTYDKQLKWFNSMAKRESEILKISKNIIGRTNWDRRVTSILSSKSTYYHVDELLRDEFYLYHWNSKDHSTIEYQIFTLSSNALYKGFETIVKTAQLLQNFTDHKFLWNVVGLSEKDNVVKIVLSWLKINLSNVNIRLWGKLPPDKFISIMLNSDVYCQVSHIENSPNSLCEAMYLGMPIVATHAGGTESMLENNHEGILVQDGDPFSIAGALLEIKKHPTRSIEMAKNARRRASLRHDPQKVVQDLIHSYEEITERK